MSPVASKPKGKKKVVAADKGPDGFSTLLEQAKSPAPAPAAAGMTVNQLAEATGSDRRSIAKWLEADGIRPTRQEKLGKHVSDIYEGAAAMDCIAKRQIATAHGSDGERIDPLTGLPWFQAKMREETLARRRDNEIEDGLKNKRLMLTETHHRVLTIIANALEQLPGKAKSELGLTAAQRDRLQKMLDDVRHGAAEEIRGVEKI